MRQDNFLGNFWKLKTDNGLLFTFVTDLNKGKGKFRLIIIEIINLFNKQYVFLFWIFSSLRERAITQIHALDL